MHLGLIYCILHLCHMFFVSKSQTFLIEWFIYDLALLEKTNLQNLLSANVIGVKYYMIPFWIHQLCTVLLKCSIVSSVHSPCLYHVYNVFVINLYLFGMPFRLMKLPSNKRKKWVICVYLNEEVSLICMTLTVKSIHSTSLYNNKATCRLYFLYLFWPNWKSMF